jgi:hypothetical protein
VGVRGVAGEGQRRVAGQRAAAAPLRRRPASTKRCRSPSRRRAATDADTNAARSWIVTTLGHGRTSERKQLGACTRAARWRRSAAGSHTCSKATSGPSGPSTPRAAMRHDHSRQFRRGHCPERRDQLAGVASPPAQLRSGRVARVDHAHHRCIVDNRRRTMRDGVRARLPRAARDPCRALASPRWCRGGGRQRRRRARRHGSQHPQAAIQLAGWTRSPAQGGSIRLEIWPPGRSGL